MQSPLFWMLSCVLTVTLAKNTLPQSSQSTSPRIGYPYPWPYPNHHHLRDPSWAEPDQSTSRKDSNDCPTLGLFSSDMFKEVKTSSPKAEYFTLKGSRRALISCPVDGAVWHMLIPNNDEFAYISSGIHIQRLVECNRGKFESRIVNGDHKITFSKVVCVKQPTTKSVISKISVSPLCSSLLENQS